MFKSRLLRESVMYLPAQVIAPVSQLLLTIALTFLADARTVGIVTTTFANQELVVLFVAWWGHYVMRHVNEHDVSIPEIWSASRRINGLAAVLQAAAGGGLCFLFMEGETAVLAIAQGLYFALRSYNAFNIQVSMVRLQRASFTVYSICGPLAGLVIGVPALKYLGPDPLWPILACALGEAAAVVYRVIADRRRASPAFNPAVLRAALHFGLPIIGSGVFTWISLNAGRYVVLQWGGVEQVGIFAIGFGLGLRSAGMLSMVTTGAAWALVLKEIAEHGRAAALQQHARNFLALAGLLVPAAVGLYLVRDEIVQILMAPQFRPQAILVLPVSTAAGVIYAFQMHYVNQFFLLDKKPMALLWLGMADAVLTVATTIAAVAGFGLLGGALGLLVAKFIMVVIVAVWAWARSGMIVPFAGLGAIGLASAIMAAVVAALPAEPVILWLAVRTIAGAATYFGTLAVIIRAHRLSGALRKG